MVSDKVRAGPTPAELRAQAAEDLLYAICGSCTHERRLDRPVNEPGALFLPHAIFLPQPHQSGELPHRREQCPGSLAPASTRLVPLFSDADSADN